MTDISSSHYKYQILQMWDKQLPVSMEFIRGTNILDTVKCVNGSYDVTPLLDATFGCMEGENYNVEKNVIIKSILVLDTYYGGQRWKPEYYTPRRLSVSNILPLEITCDNDVFTGILFIVIILNLIKLFNVDRRILREESDWIFPISNFFGNVHQSIVDCKCSAPPYELAYICKDVLDITNSDCINQIEYTLQHRLLNNKNITDKIKTQLKNGEFAQLRLL